MQILHNFTHFFSKTTHINLSKTLFICKITVVIVHICTVTITFYMIILYFFSLLSLSLLDSLSPTLQCQEEEEEADRQHPSTITTNQPPPPPPPPTHYDINLIQTQSTQNYWKSSQTQLKINSSREWVFWAMEAW